MIITKSFSLEQLTRLLDDGESMVFTKNGSDLYVDFTDTGIFEKEEWEETKETKQKFIEDMLGKIPKPASAQDFIIETESGVKGDRIGAIMAKQLLIEDVVDELHRENIEVVEDEMKKLYGILYNHGRPLCLKNGCSKLMNWNDNAGRYNFTCKNHNIGPTSLVRRATRTLKSIVI